MFSLAKIISIAFERPCCAERNVCKSVFGFGIVNFPFTLNWGIKRIKPSGLHNNSDCSDKVAAPESDEADTATANRTSFSVCKHRPSTSFKRANDTGYGRDHSGSAATASPHNGDKRRHDPVHWLLFF